MKIIISPRAEKQLRRISKADQLFLARKIRNLKQEKPTTEEKLSGFKNIYRVRVGNYRIVYKKNSDLVYIILIGHRKEIYLLIKRLIS